MSCRQVGNNMVNRKRKPDDTRQYHTVLTIVLNKFGFFSHNTSRGRENSAAIVSFNGKLINNLVGAWVEGGFSPVKIATPKIKINKNAIDQVHPLSSIVNDDSQYIIS